jgi:hypothetical protein
MTFSFWGEGMSKTIEPLQIHVDDAVLEDLTIRLFAANPSASRRFTAGCVDAKTRDGSNGFVSDVPPSIAGKPLPPE